MKLTTWGVLLIAAGAIINYVFSLRVVASVIMLVGALLIIIGSLGRPSKKEKKN